MHKVTRPEGSDPQYISGGREKHYDYYYYGVLLVIITSLNCVLLHDCLRDLARGKIIGIAMGLQFELRQISPLDISRIGVVRHVAVVS